ncbi:phage integrase N-terminal SAM-like domain-containing protein [Aquimarina algiphila]|uniref:Core-binding (CB) domain-containing protein n=1 Tax=Aquimarina algiphila TaxID=2047982 RepID=A0A554VKB5_9FLAO|nr:phage integrase N-terminal SAM-like domain-containing protein [Aquimarina algiphila]TSE08410.1 hypothetical protein FOF46_12705 [Aquimarina algiphila]
MASILSKLRTEYGSEYKLKNYTDPKIYHGGKDFDLSKRWYVYYNFKNPHTGEMKRQPPIYYNINKEFKTKRERIVALQELKDDILELLKQGYSPYEDREHSNSYTAKEALQFALSIKKNVIATKSYTDYGNRLSHFIEFLEKKGLASADIKDIEKKHVVEFLNGILNQSSARNRNNSKTVLSALFTVLEDNDLILRNFIKSINKEKSTPKKNKAFTMEEVTEIFSHLKKKDKWLYYYCSHVYHGLFRPIEVMRIKVKNVNIKDRLVESDTKTGEYYKQIPNVLYDEFYSLFDFENLNKEFDVFTKFGKPEIWDSKEESKRDYFGDLFRKKVKEKFNFSNDYTVYSLRHSAIGKLFVEKINELREKKEPNFEEKALDFVRSITLHKDNKMTRNYLREIGYYKIDDWSDLFK